MIRVVLMQSSKNAVDFFALVMLLEYSHPGRLAHVWHL